MVRLYGRRGTVGGLRELVRIYTGEEPEIMDNGGSAWSPEPGGELPGSEDIPGGPRQHITSVGASIQCDRCRSQAGARAP
jgi:hypothetical protein